MSQHSNSDPGNSGFSDMSDSTSGFGQEDGGDPGSQIRQQGSAGVGQIKSGASTLTNKAREQISRYADAQKSTVTKQIDTLVAAIRQAGEELGQNEQAQASQLVTQVADGLEGLSRTIDDMDVSDVLNSVRRFGRSNPAIFVGGALLAGIALARFARASSASRSGQGGQDWQNGGSSGSGGWSGRPDAQFGSHGSSGSSRYTASGSTGSFRTGGAASYGGPGATGAGGLGSAAAAGAGSGAGGFGGTGGGLSGGNRAAFVPSTAGAGDAPQASQGYAGGGMGRDPIQSSAGSSRTSSPSSATEPSVGGSSTSGGGMGSGSISTGENS